MISLWPVRCGVVVDRGTVYACAGLFPSQGAYLCALSANDGKELWKQPVDISAQGYLLASSERLFIPTGRTPPHIYRRTDGEQVAAFPGLGQQRSGAPEGGGCFAVLVDDQLLHQAGEKGGIQVTNAESREKVVATFGLRVIARGEVAYILQEDRLTALDRAAHFELARLEQKKKKSPADQERIGELKKKQQRWDVPCAAPYELIMAGETIFVGGADKVVAYRAADGKQVWTGAVTGKAHSLSVAGGRLFVGTDRGTIHSFRHGPSSSSGRVVSPNRETRTTSLYPDDDATPLYRRAAATALRVAGPQKGYCLVLGAETGRLAYEIARRSELRVIGVEPDAAKVATARRLLTRAGLYGSRVVMHQAELDELPYQKRFANLVVSDATLVTGKPASSAAEVYRLLRPGGGTAVWVRRPSDGGLEDLAKWAAEGLPGARVAKSAAGDHVLTARRGPLEGAGEWTHFYADPGNTACSRDAIKPGPVDVQWFGRPGPRKMVDRHEKNVAPLYKDGRLFIPGDNYVVAVDAYNGAVLWEHDLPDSIRLGAFKNCGGMAVTDELLYVASGGTCLGFDVASGEKRLLLTVPEELAGEKSEWGYVASVDNLLVGSVTKPGATFRVQDVPTQTLIWRDRQPLVSSDSLFALNRHSGEPLWTYTPEQGVILNPTIALGGGRLYCIESANPATRDVADGRITLDLLLDKGSNLVALDTSTGDVLWRKPAELEELEHIVFLSYARETLVVTGTKNVTVGEKEKVRYDLSAYDAATGKRLWKSTQTPVPDHILQGPHGEQVQHSALVGGTIYNTGFSLDLKTGRPTDGWRWQKSDKCGAVSTSSFCAFSRYSNPRMFDLGSGEYRALSNVTRPGCWINIIPAGGQVLIPEASSGCSCYYSIQTSIALTPRDGKP